MAALSRGARVVVGALSASALAAPVSAVAPGGTLDEVVVTAARMTRPVIVVTDPRQPRQPLPAHDGADYLKAIPGFAVIRKGGTDGDPVFRGMAASRVGMSLDGEQVLGGCGMRMDPPTAYVFPESYDRIVIVKGPQTVLHGPGNSAGAVSFERDAPATAAPGLQARGSALAGSFGRADIVGSVRAASASLYATLDGSRAESGDYADGDGRDVHSRYFRWTGNAALGWTPDADTRIELSLARSDGEAAYADRAMDGAKFARDNVGVRAEFRRPGQRVAAVKTLLYRNYVDHVMDNYSLRPFVASAAMPAPSASNPDRTTTGGRLSAELVLGSRLTGTVGVELQRNVHALRSTMNETLRPYETMDRVQDARFRQTGLFAEGTYALAARTRAIAGARIDGWQARDARATVAVGMMGSAANPTAGLVREATLPGGFVRLEHDLAARPATVYAGVGHVERFPDYWELVSTGRESTTSLSAFGTRPERTSQLDAGVIVATARASLSLSAFASEVDDYILIQSNYAKGMRTTSVTRNVDARTWGGEADARYRVSQALALTGSLAWVRGRNATDGLPLAQLPPLEARLGVEWSRGAWTAGLLARGVAAQDRVAPGQGNVVGQDLGRTPGFGVLSLNAAWRPSRTVQLAAGIDNLLDRTYAEHLSRAGAMVAGYGQTTRVSEPGRVIWAKLGMSL